MAAKKKKKVNPVPKEYPGVIAYLNLEGASAALALYKKALGAKLRMKLDMPGNRIGHSELEINGGVVMVADPFPGSPTQTAQLLFYVPDVDKAHKKAVKAGMTSLMPPTDMFYGDRSCRLQDSFGVIWFLASHVEDVSPAEMKKRMKAMAM